MNPHVDQYLIHGCGRCAYYKTPKCKVHFWSEELIQLRRIVLECGLEEEYKWSQPCYTVNGKNVLVVTAFKDYACISFFKGGLLKDPHGILITPGNNSQAFRQLRHTDSQEIIEQEAIIKEYVRAAVEIEKAGKKVEFKKQPEVVPEELKLAFKDDPDFKKAFESLTPGRQRGYLIYFNGAKQSATRASRIDKCRTKIIERKGLNEY